MRRIPITNLTDRDVAPYVALAAKVVKVSGVIPARVYYVRRGAWKWYSGYADYGKRSIQIGMPRSEYFKPFARTTLGYFRSHEIPLHKPYHVDTWEELLVEIAAHEFAHHMPRGKNYRKSKIELFCELKAAEALDLLRSPEGQAFIRDYHKPAIARLVERRRKADAVAAFKASPHGKLAVARAAEKRWLTKAKRAATALRKLRSKIRRLETKLRSMPAHPTATQS